MTSIIVSRTKELIPRRKRPWSQTLNINMDLNSLKDQVAGLSLYDIKAGVRKVQNGM